MDDLIKQDVILWFLLFLVTIVSYYKIQGENVLLFGLLGLMSVLVVLRCTIKRREN